VNFAFPPLSCAVPSIIFPTAKVTGPVGITVGEVIVAVKVIACPKVDGLGDDVIVAELVVCNTVWFSTGEVLPRLFRSPLYTATKE
jgi:hypothetical protein